jgi:uncharacterized protein YwgA
MNEILSVGKLMVRTFKDKAIDYLLTIYLINDAFSRRNLRFLSETKLQKLVFLSEKSMIDERQKGFNFYFIKLTHGPFSQELRRTVEKLLQTRFLNDFRLEPTDNVKLILEDFQGVIERNQTFFQKIDTVNDRFARMGLEQLLDVVYAMPWGRGGARTIAELPPRTPMLYPMKPHVIVKEFKVTDDEAEDLLMNFDPEAIKDLSEAMKDAREGRWRTYEQVFSDL